MNNMQIKDVIDNCCLKICTVTKKEENGKSQFDITDCNDQFISIEKIKDIKDDYKRYRQNNKKQLKFQNLAYSTVWIMVDADKNIIFQIGQTKSFDKMFKGDLEIDIKGLTSNVAAIKSKDKKKKERAQKYTNYVKNNSISKIEIYEVHLEKFLEEACIALPIGVNKDFNEEMLFYVKSFIVEGAIGKMFFLNENNSLWKFTGGLDGMSYNLYMRYENMVIEIIKFLQKWGLWEGTLIFSDGNMYAYSDDKADTYNGIPYVKFEKNVDSTKYTSENGKDYSNPEHLFDMVFDSSLHTLLADGDYEVNGSDLSDDAWEEIFQHTYLINDYTADNFEVFDAEDVLERLVFSGDKYDSQIWDTLEFDSWEDYLAENFGLENHLNNTSSNGYQILSVDDIMPLWEKLSDIAKNEIKSEYQSQRLYLPEIRSYVIEQFNKIFEKYGLWYDFGFSWSLSCYKK